MSKLLYAAYGSNLHPVRLGQRVPSAELLGTALLPNLSLLFNKRSTDGSGKCNIVDSGSGVYVAVYAMNKDEKATLDKYEGCGKGYDETKIEVPNFGDCFTYLANETHIDNELLPYCWYKEFVLVGCRKLDFPSNYVAAVNAIKPVRDSNEKRCSENWRLAETLRGCA